MEEICLWNTRAPILSAGERVVDKLVRDRMIELREAVKHG